MRAEFMAEPGPPIGRLRRLLGHAVLSANEGETDTLVTLAMALIVFPLTFRQSNLYTTNRARTHISEVFELFKATLFASIRV